MKKITIKYPDDMPESEVAKYLYPCFDDNASHYLAMTPNGAPNNIVFSTGRKAIMTMNTNGYTLDIKKMEKTNESK